tara:strand:+ start:166176 stop:167411 length:1236 start_codon:yes stop_codon:yes gene_type:complete
MAVRYDLVVVGGGAAGIFGAVNACIQNPGLKVAVVEKTSKWLGKVKVSGGGRCNVTHDCQYASQLVKNYPRGGKFLKKVFDQFDARDTVKWFEERGVPLKVEADGRMFPVTNSSQTVIDCLLKEAEKYKVELIPHFAVKALERTSGSFLVKSETATLEAVKILVTIGGQPKEDGFSWVKALGHTIVPPVPSLFTFNVPEGGLKELSGVAVPSAEVKVAGRGLAATGPLLITHWGFSGPAVLRLSAWGARDLAEIGYKSLFLVNWLGDKKEEALRGEIESHAAQSPKKVVFGNPMYGLPGRLWEKIVERAGITPERRWLDLSKKDKNRLCEMLIRCAFDMDGKTTFKEEFVTCGGVSLDEVNPATMESRIVPGLYFAGEVLDIDGVTGGFNFQNAWSGGWVAAKAISSKSAQ